MLCFLFSFFCCCLAKSPDILLFLSMFHFVIHFVIIVIIFYSFIPVIRVFQNNLQINWIDKSLYQLFFFFVERKISKILFKLYLCFLRLSLQCFSFYFLYFVHHKIKSKSLQTRHQSTLFIYTRYILSTVAAFCGW